MKNVYDLINECNNSLEKYDYQDEFEKIIKRKKDSMNKKMKPIIDKIKNEMIGKYYSFKNMSKYVMFINVKDVQLKYDEEDDSFEMVLIGNTCYSDRDSKNFSIEFHSFDYISPDLEEYDIVELTKEEYYNEINDLYKKGLNRIN